ncbi:hypothetical protein P3W24_15450 [Luteibacter sp. PPL201]|uniref:Uncharacterized protein n=1 Tax=Luteibacter sahnii TaxID=3021977 RepID=A0ABT6BEU0_9GAMM
MPSPGDVDPLRRVVVADVTALFDQAFDPSVTAFAPVAVTGALTTAIYASLRGHGFRVGTYPLASLLNCEVTTLADRQYLVTVTAGPVRYTRLWIVDGATAYAGGPWTRSE